MNTQSTMKLSVLGLGLAIAVTWALGVFFLGLLATCCGWGTAMVNSIGTFYLGYAATVLGSIIGGVWAFVDGFVGGALIALFYNWFTPKK